jgi:DoxX-like family
MTVTNAVGGAPIDGASISLKLTMWYWVPTLYVVLTNFLAGATDILHAPPLYTETLRLGYPPHFSTLLGAWKVLGAIVLLAPRYPLVKEWAYAGFFIDFTAAVIAHVATGDGIAAGIGPVVSVAALITSWYLRPTSRRLA